MPVIAVACHCGSSDSIVHTFLKKIGFRDWLTIRLEKGREKSLGALNYLPPTPEKEALREYIKKANKWAIIIGYDDQTVEWSDITHNLPKSKIDAEFIAKNFEFD